MKKLFVIVAAIFAFATVSAQSTNEIITKYNTGVEAITAKEWGKAAEALEAVVKGGISSEDNQVLNCVTTAKKYIPTCYQRLGTAAASKKQYDEAIAYLTKAADKAVAISADDFDDED